MRWWVRGDLCNEGLRGEQMKGGKEEGMGEIRKRERREGEEREERKIREPHRATLLGAVTGAVLAS